MVNYFIEKRGAIGSCLHKSEKGLWVAYSRWPDKATRDAAWPGSNSLNADFPQDVLYAIHTIQAIIEENKHLESQHEICLEVVEDLL